MIEITHWKNSAIYNFPLSPYHSSLVIVSVYLILNIVLFVGLNLIPVERTRDFEPDALAEDNVTGTRLSVLPGRTSNRGANSKPISLKPLNSTDQLQFSSNTTSSRHSRHVSPLSISGNRLAIIDMYSILVLN